MKAEPGTILELGLAAQEMMTEIAARLTAEPGVLLALDYGSMPFTSARACRRCALIVSPMCSKIQARPI